MESAEAARPYCGRWTPNRIAAEGSGAASGERMFYHDAMEQLFELGRRTFDTPGFRGLEFIEVEAKTILNRVPGNWLPFNWSVNPYRGCSHACSYCFARPTHTYLDLEAGRDFETKILVKVNAPGRLRAELRARRWKGETVAMGTNTDPYQRAEGKYHLMPGILRALIDARNPFSILTKGTLILRDLPVLEEAASLGLVSTAMSVPTVSTEVWKSSEPGTPHPRRRLDAVARLNEAGIPCGVMMMPVLPGISDDPDLLRETATAIAEAGATWVYAGLVNVRPGVSEEYMGWLRREHPDLVERYEQMYRRAYATASANAAVKEVVDVTIRKAGRGGLGHDRFRRPASGEATSAPPPQQLRLV